jgi:hypothetical protein
MAKFAKVQNKRIIAVSDEELTEEERKQGVTVEEVDDKAKPGDEFVEDEDAAG